MAFQSNAFQNNAFQVIRRAKSHHGYEEAFREREKSPSHRRNWMQILADEAFQKQMEDLKQDELDFLDLLVIMLVEES